MKRRIAFTVLAVALVWPLWWLGGKVEMWTGLDDLDVLGPVAFVFLGLALAEKLLSRFQPPTSYTSGPKS